MDLNYEVIGKRIKELRQKKHLTQEKLAEMCNLSASYISYIESAKKKRASLESLVKLANNLGVTVDTFLNGYQKNDTNEYESALMRLFEDCSSNEKLMMIKITVFIKEILRDNN
jgi:transcriptional regulator with XRE-family HTH domain